MPIFHSHVTLPNLAINPGDTVPNPGSNRQGSIAYSTIIRRNVTWDGTEWQAEPGNTIFIKQNGDPSSILLATPVYIGLDGFLHKTKADDVSTLRIAGFVLNTNVPSGGNASVMMSGVMTADVGSWQLVTGEPGGLTQGMQYYLDADAAGRITNQLPSLSGLYIAPVGSALSSTEFEIKILSPYQL